VVNWSLEAEILNASTMTRVHAFGISMLPHIYQHQLLVSVWQPDRYHQPASRFFLYQCGGYPPPATPMPNFESLRPPSPTCHPFMRRFKTRLTYRFTADCVVTASTPLENLSSRFHGCYLDSHNACPPRLSILRGWQGKLRRHITQKAWHLQQRQTHKDARLGYEIFQRDGYRIASF
jgi:hypothetical protein